MGFKLSDSKKGRLIPLINNNCGLNCIKVPIIEGRICKAKKIDKKKCFAEVKCFFPIIECYMKEHLLPLKQLTENSIPEIDPQSRSKKELNNVVDILLEISKVALKLSVKAAEDKPRKRDIDRLEIRLDELRSKLSPTMEARLSEHIKISFNKINASLSDIEASVEPEMFLKTVSEKANIIANDFSSSYNQKGSKAVSDLLDFWCVTLGKYPSIYEYGEFVNFVSIVTGMDESALTKMLKRFNKKVL